MYVDGQIENALALNQNARALNLHPSVLCTALLLTKTTKNWHEAFLFKIKKKQHIPANCVKNII